MYYFELLYDELCHTLKQIVVDNIFTKIIKVSNKVFK